MCKGSLGDGTFILREALERASSQNEFVMSVTISAQVLYSTVRALPTVNRDGFTNHSDGCDDSFVALLGADTNHNREVLCFKDRLLPTQGRTTSAPPPATSLDLSRFLVSHFASARGSPLERRWLETSIAPSVSNSKSSARR